MNRTAARDLELRRIAERFVLRERYRCIIRNGRAASVGVVVRTGRPDNNFGAGSVKRPIAGTAHECADRAVFRYTEAAVCVGEQFDGVQIPGRINAAVVRRERARSIVQLRHIRIVLANGLGCRLSVRMKREIVLNICARSK